MVDWEDEAQDQPKDLDQLGALSTMVDRMLDLQAWVDETERSLKTLKESYRKINEDTIPELMNAMNLKDLTTESGKKLSVKKTYQARIAAKDAEAAFAWLEEHGHGSVVRDEIGVSLGAGEGEMAIAAVEALQGLNLDVSRKQSVHSSTLKALVKSELEQGTDMPRDVFSIFEGYKTTIK